MNDILDYTMFLRLCILLRLREKEAEEGQIRNNYFNNDSDDNVDNNELKNIDGNTDAYGGNNDNRNSEFKMTNE